MEYPETEQVNKNKRRGLWIGCGLAALVLLCIGLVVAAATGIAAAAFGSIKSSDVYKQAMAEVGSHPEVANTLGTPIEAGWLVSGSISVENAAGDANLAIPISGPKGKGTLYVEATRSAGVWTMNVIQVEVDGRAEPINLLREEGR